MTLGSSRTRLIVIAAITLAVVAFLLLRGGDAPRRGATGGGDGSAGASSDVADGPSRGAAGRAGGGEQDDPGAEFRNSGARATVTGRVVDATSRAGVVGVEVLFDSAAGEVSVTSGTDGRFSVGLAPGSHQVRAVGDNLYGAPRALMVGQVSGLQLEIEVSALARIEGHVIGADGGPVEDATVAALVAGRELQGALDQDSVSPSVQSGADGSFQLQAFPGAVRVVADHPTEGHGRSSVQAGVDDDHVVVQLAPYATLSGVVNGPGGQGMAGATVTLSLKVPGTERRERLSATSSAGGRFEIRDIIYGKTVVDATAAGYAPAAPVEVRLGAGERRDDLVLSVGVSHQLTGRVVDGNGQPVYRAMVKLDREGSARDIGPARTDRDGRFHIDGLDDGVHDVTVTTRTGGLLRLRFAVIPDEPVELVLEEPGTLRGAVTDAAGQPVREFTIAIDGLVPAHGGSRGRLPPPAHYVSAQGRFEWSSLAPGTYDLTFSADGYASVQRTGVAVTPGDATDVSTQLAAP